MGLIKKRQIAQGHKWLGRLTLIILAWFAVTAMGITLANYYHLQDAPLIQNQVNLQHKSHPALEVSDLTQLDWAQLHTLSMDLSSKGFIDLPTEPHKAWTLRFANQWAWLDPVSKQVDIQGHWLDSPVGFWIALHRGKLWGKGFNQVLVALTWLLSAAIILSLLLGLPKLRWPKKIEHKLFYCHQVLGVIISPLLLICLLTGLVFAYAKDIKPNLAEFKLSPIENTDTVNGALLWLDKNHPGYRISRYYWSKAGVKIRFAFKDELHPKGNNFIHINEGGTFFQESKKQDFLWQAYYQSWPLHSFNWLKKPLNHYAAVILCGLLLILVALILLRWRKKWLLVLYKTRDIKDKPVVGLPQ